MKKIIVLVLMSFCFYQGFSQKKKDLIKEVAQLKLKSVALQEKLAFYEQQRKVNLQDSLQNFGYAFGLGIGNNLKTLGFDTIASQAFRLALDDVIAGKEKISLKEAQRIVQGTIEHKQEKEAKEKSKEGLDFLAENGKRADVVTTESGLQYQELIKGDGAIPKASERVKVHYTGMLINGDVFDSSVERGEPSVFGVTQVIKGWQEVLQLMPVGSKWKVFIPQELAYGARGAGGGEIPPYAALIFEMELLGIE
jgi:FKBP-type peptidyl-prolyl cis-trans isomerase FklB